MSAQSFIYNPTQTTSAATGDGFSVPRLTTVGRLAISFTTSDAGMMVFDTDIDNLFIWNGTAWESVPASGDAGVNGSVQYNDSGVVSGASNFIYDKATSAVSITGALDAARLNVTAGTIPANGVYLGSANNLSFSAASTLAMTLNSTGLGVGVSPSYRFDVLASGTISGRFKTAGAINALYLEDSGTTAGSLYIGSAGNEFRVVTGSNVALAIDINRNTSVGPTTLATAATDGFFYIPGFAGAPTGVPTAKAGRIPMAVDTTNNRFYMYVNSAWKFAALV